jgi:hypothetical protein
VDLQVRDARITDIDRIMALLERARRVQSADSGDIADLLRRLVYLPNASLSIVTQGREAVGAALLTLRPSVSAAGLIGTIDLFVHETSDAGDVAELLLAELVRSARNKGCVLIEAPAPARGGELRRWQALGFHNIGTRLGRPISPTVASA